MNIRNLLLSAASALALLSCGGGGGSMSAGGIGGTGVSSGPVTGFGSVIVNGVEYNTDAANFTIEGSAAGTGSNGQNKLAAGMTVSVTHDGSNPPLAKSVSYQDNAEGPIDNITIIDSATGAGTFTALGLTVTVNNLTVFANTSGLIGSTALGSGDIVEVSGQITATNELVATRVEKKTSTCGTTGLQIEVKGTVSNVSAAGAGSFDISSSQASLHVNANGHLPSTLQNSDYIKVQSSACPTSGTLIASAVVKDSSIHEGPDLSELDAGATELEIKGVVAGAGGSSPNCTFTVNGQAVQTTSSTQITSGNCTTLTNDTRVEIDGHLSGGTLIASSVQNEDSESVSTANYVGTVNVDPNHTTFEGTIHVIGTSGDSGPIAVDLNTQFESDTQPYNLDTMDGTSTCAEVEVNTIGSGDKHAISIHHEDCPH